MASGKAPAYIGMLMTILVLSLLVRDSSVAVLALPLLAIVFLSSLLQNRGTISLASRREIGPSTLAVIQPVRVELTVTNLSKNRMRSLYVEDELPPGLRVISGSNRTIVDLGSAETTTLRYYVRPTSRGLYRIGPTRIRYSDPLELFISQNIVGSADSIFVYPRQHSVRARIESRRTGPWWGSTLSQKAGAGMEFHGIRDYQMGDELHSINWKATARLAKIVTNEYETERASDAVLLVDAGKLSGTLLDDKSMLDYEAEAALAIASFLLNNGNRVGLVLHGRFRHWLYPGFGSRQYLKLREQLMLAREGDSEIPLSFLISQLAPMILKRGSQVILIAHPFSLDLPGAIASLQNLGYRVRTILIQPYQGGGSRTPASLAARIMMLETEEAVKEIQRLCPTAYWWVDEPLDNVFRRLDQWLRAPQVFAR